MNVKAIKKQLVAAIAMVVVAIIALISATYAWFVTNNEVKATTTKISAQSNAAFMTIDNGDSGASTVDTTSVSTTLSKTALYPATFGEESGATEGQFMTGYGSSLDDGTLNGVLRIVGTSGTPDEADTAEYAVKEQFNVSSKGQNLSDLKVDSIVTETGATSGQLLSSALRILITNATGDKWVVYGLNAGGDAYEIKLSSEAGKDNPVLGNVTSGSDTVVNVYMYYEGSDENIKTRNLQNNKLDESQSVTITFAATPDNK